MKKIVFLFCLLLFTSTQTSIHAFDSTHDFAGFSVELDYYRDGNTKGYHITKKGVEPFRITIQYPDSSLIINDVVLLDNYLVYYGSIHINGNDTYYDAYYLVTDLNGNIISEYNQDFGDLEEIINVFEIDGIFVIHVEERNDPIGDQFEFTRNIFIGFDETYTNVYQTEIYLEIFNYKVTENYYLYSHDNTNNFEGGLRNDLTIISYDDIPVITSNAKYNEIFFLDFINEGILNGERIFNGHLIDYPGNYTFDYNNSTFDFVVTSTITGVENNSVYSEPVYPFISRGLATLNNDIFLSGEDVSLPGYYNLEVIGENGYQESISFTITSNLEGILNNHSYSEEVELTFNGEGYLNNQHIDSPFIVSEEGEYQFKITGENNYMESYFFSITEPKRDTSMISFIQKYDIIILSIVAVSGMIILKKK